VPNQSNQIKGIARKGTSRHQGQPSAPFERDGVPGHDCPVGGVGLNGHQEFLEQAAVAQRTPRRPPRKAVTGRSCTHPPGRGMRLPQLPAARCSSSTRRARGDSLRSGDSLVVRFPLGDKDHLCPADQKVFTRVLVAGAGSPTWLSVGD
jgi:hypothetical protein